MCLQNRNAPPYMQFANTKFYNYKSRSKVKVTYFCMYNSKALSTRYTHNEYQSSRPSVVKKHITNVKVCFTHAHMQIHPPPSPHPPHTHGPKTICPHNLLYREPKNNLLKRQSLYFHETATVLPAKSDSDFMFSLQSYQGLIMDRSLEY